MITVKSKSNRVYYDFSGKKFPCKNHDLASALGDAILVKISNTIPYDMCRPSLLSKIIKINDQYN